MKFLVTTDDVRVPLAVRMLSFFNELEYRRSKESDGEDEWMTFLMERCQTFFLGALFDCHIWNVRFAYLIHSFCNHIPIHLFSNGNEGVACCHSDTGEGGFQTSAPSSLKI